MHVLHVISGLDVRSGGTVAALAGMVNGQLKTELDVSVAATWFDGYDTSVSDQLKNNGAELHLVGPCKTPLAIHHDINPTLEKVISEVDIVHIHTLWEQIQHRAARIAHQLQTPYVITPHGMLDPWCLKQSRVKKSIYLTLRLRKNLNHATALHFTANDERKLTAPLNLKAPTIIEPNGINLEEFETLPEPGEFRKQYPQLGDRPFVLFLSRIHHKKGLDILIPAFAKTQSPDTMLVIAGPADDDYLNVIKNLIDKHQLNDRVILPGMLYGKDRIRAFVDAELFALSSYQENFGIVVAEALACSTPVLISDQVNIHDQITDAQVGQTIDLNQENWTKSLDHWLSDHDLRQKTAEKARPFVWENYNWDNIAIRWQEHYHNLVGR